MSKKNCFCSDDDDYNQKGICNSPITSTKMEVDPPSSSSTPGQTGSNLKRSNSAPMINMLVTSQAETSNTQSSFKPANSTALRRLSSSNMMLQNMPAASTSPPIRGPDRVARIKQEEIHIADRERQHEREIQSSFFISNNWDNLSLDCSEPMDSQHRRPRSFSESLHIMTQSNILCGSPSPTRGSIKQCFSPSMQIPVKNTTFTPSPSPSPTRKNFMRSLSPIAMRSATLKRKLDNDVGDRWDHLTPPKKYHTGPLTPDRLMTQPHPLAHSISSSSLEETSPEQPMSRCSGGSNVSSSSSLCIHPHPQGTIPGMRSPHHTLGAPLPPGQQSPLSSSGAPSPLSSSGHGSMGSIGSGGNNNVGASVGMGTPFPVVLSSKQGFLFRPVSEAMGSPSSSSSSSSSSLSIPHHPHHHSPQHHQSPTPHHHHHHHHHSSSSLLSMSSPAVEQSEGNTSTSDIYMSDSEMGEVNNAKSVTMEEQVSYNFKPISPDHHS